ncbi:DNA polymerase III subunit delta' [Actinobacillus equuli]|nr:DNA polymerase III subunit delta' [Actinobacillus equuli]
MSSTPADLQNFLENDRLQARKTFLQTFWRFFKSRDVLLLFTAFDKEKELVLQQLEWLDSFLPMR